MKHASLVLLTLALGWASAAPAASRFVRNCGVHAEPSLMSRFVCHRRRGERPLSSSREDEQFVKVEFKDCSGYVTNGCIAETDGTLPVKRRVSSSETSDDGAPWSAAGPVKLGLQIDLGLPFATISTSNSGSHGIGYGVGFQLLVPLSENFEFVVVPSYESLSLNHDLDPTSSDPIKDSVASYSQHYQYFGGMVLLSYAIQRAYRATVGDPDWWLDGGVQYLHPLSATQSSFDQSTPIPAVDKLFFLVAGPRGDYPFAKNFYVSGSLQGFYNLGSTGGSHLFGARLLVAVNLAL